ncbi:MAG: hypothetical protein ACPGJV_03620 [Bacteriovoracaceae bacterium]
MQKEHFYQEFSREFSESFLFRPLNLVAVPSEPFKNQASLAGIKGNIQGDYYFDLTDAHAINPLGFSHPLWIKAGLVAKEQKNEELTQILSALKDKLLNLSFLKIPYDIDTLDENSNSDSKTWINFIELFHKLWMNTEISKKMTQTQEELLSFTKEFPQWKAEGLKITRKGDEELYQRYKNQGLLCERNDETLSLYFPFNFTSKELKTIFNLLEQNKDK